MDRNKPGYMNFDDIADRLESGKLNAYDVVYTKDTHEVVFIKEDLSLIRMKCRLDVYPSVVVAEYYLNLNTDTYVGQIVGIEQGEWICLYNVNYADNKFIVRKVGVDEYGQLANKPQINGVTLEGNKTTEQLGINIPTKFSQLYDDIGYVTFDHLIENYYSKSQTYSKSEVDTALAGKADTSDIPTDLADLQDDSTHRTVTDENIAAWNAKSNVVANPSETTGALNSIEIDGVAYAVAGSGGGAVHSVNGKTGDVVLGASDVHALPDDTPLFSGDYNDLENKPDIPDDLADLHDDTNHRTVTDAEKTQWNAAEPNVQPDWNQTITSADDYIKNKPANLVQDANYVHTDNNFTNANKTKLNDIEAGAEVNVQSDWNQTDSTQDDYIKNKPAIPDPQIQSDWNQTNNTAKDFIKNKPTIPASQVNSDWNASSGVAEILNKPILGTAAAKDSTNAVTQGSTDLVESGAVWSAIDNLPEPMVFKGTLGVNGTITSLPTASSSNNGYTYKVITDGTYDGKSAKVGDVFTSNGSEWVLIPSGDETFTDTWRSVKVNDTELLGSSITTGAVNFKSGSNVSITGSGNNITIEAQDTTYSKATAQADGLMSKEDFSKLSDIETGAQVNTITGVKGNAEVDYRIGNVNITPTNIGLGNVDNTSDATKKTNFTGSIASENTGFVTGGDAYTELAKKVDKVDGKGLSSNDYTTTEKDKLAGIATGAEVNVQSDWNQSDNTKDDYIKNKPDNLVQDASYVHTDNNYTSDEKTKLSGIAANAEVNQNAFSNVKVGSITIASGEKTATLELEAGSNITLTPDTANKKVVLAATDTTYSDATTSVHGLMSAADKTKLDGISTGANKVESSETNGNIKIDTVETQVYDDSEIQEVIDTSYEETDYANPLSLETMQAQTAKNTKIKLDPIQDLHGYDKPWTGGAGKNIWNIDPYINQMGGRSYTYQNVQVTINSDYSIKLNGTVGDPEFLFPTVTVESGNQYPDQDIYKFLKPSTSYVVSKGISNTDIVIEFYYKATSSSGWTKAAWTGDPELTITTPASWYCLWIRFEITKNKVLNNVTIYPMIRLAGTTDTYEPYSNICPISGHDQIDILGCGKNLWDEDWESGSINGSTGAMIVDANYIRSKNFTRIIPTETYYVFSMTSGTIFALYYDENENYIGKSAQVISANTSFIPNVTNAAKVKFVFTQSTYDETNRRALLLNSETDKTYSPYQSSNNLSIDLPSTVYGGVLDLESGELVIDKVNVDLSTLDFSGSTPSIYAWRSDSLIGIIEPPANNYALPNAICDSYYGMGYTPISSSDIGAFAVADKTSSAPGRLVIVDNRFSSISDFINGISGKMMCYELATPQTIQLTPHQLSLLKAQNNLTTSQYTQVKITYRNGVFATLEPATDLTDGLMSAMDKLKLDNIVPATTTTDGLMTATDKSKLDGVADDATKTESSTTNGNIKINGTETQVYDDSEIKGELSTDTTTIEGNPLNFTTLSAQTAKSTILSLEPIQDLSHGVPSPDNICPITGRSSVDIKSKTHNTYEYSVFDGYFSTNGSAFISSSSGSKTVYYYLQSGRYKFVKTATSNAFRYCESELEPNVGVSLSNIVNLNAQTDREYEFTLNSAKYVSFFIINGADPRDVEHTTEILNSISLTSYNVITIQFGQTVYGGTLDVENGVLVVDRAIKTYNGSESWILQEKEYNYFNSQAVIDSNIKSGSTLLANEFEDVNISGTNQVIGIHLSSTNKLQIRYVVDNNVTESDLQTWLSNNNLQVCYELATPITYQLTPHTIKLLEGVNNISTDGDSITLTYRDGSVATLGDLTSAVDNLDSKIDESKILTDTATGDKYILVVTNGVLSVEQVSN